MAWERLGPDSFSHNHREFSKFMLMVHLAKYVLIKVTLAFMLHSLLLVKRSLNQSTAKQIEKVNGQPQSDMKVYCIREENFEKERNPPKIYYFKAFLPMTEDR